MNKIYYLASCDTCRKIIKSLPKNNDLVFHDIKQDPISEKDLEIMYFLSGSYEALFSKKAQLYKSMDLKNKSLNEEDYKKYILEQISSGKTNLDAKDITINQLKNEIATNKYNNKALLDEIKIIFPEIENISISNHSFIKNKDSATVRPVLIYASKTNLTDESKRKLKLWLQKRLSKEKIEIYKQENN